jgi:hypothetical protein
MSGGFCANERSRHGSRLLATETVGYPFSLLDSRCSISEVLFERFPQTLWTTLLSLTILCNFEMKLYILCQLTFACLVA